MPELFEDAFPAATGIEGKTVEELLLLVSDEEQGWKPHAMELLQMRGLEEIYPTLEEAVRDDGNADLRNGAMEVLVRFGKAVVPKLLLLLRDDNEEVRNFSAVMLGDVGSREAVAGLIQALSDPDANVRHGAAEALGKIGDRAALLPLLELLDEDFWQQYPVVVALGEMRDNRAIPHLLQLLSNEMLSEPAIEALEKIADPRALPSLVEMLNDPAARSAGSAARAIVAIQKSLNDRVRYKNSLGEYGHMATVVERVDRQGRESLRKLLSDNSDRDKAIAAAMLLGWMEEADALPQFFPLLREGSFCEAIEGAIIAIGSPAIQYLLPALCHADMNVQLVALRTLRWLGGINDCRRVVPHLESACENVQLEALETVKGSIDDTLLPVLERLLEHGRPAVRLRTLEVMTLYPSSTVLMTFERLKAASDPETRKYAATLAGVASNSIPADASLLLVNDPAIEVRREAIRMAGYRKLGEAIPLLIAALRDSDQSIRVAAVTALVEFGAEAPLPELLQLLGCSGVDLDCAVIKGVARIGNGAACSALVDYLKNSHPSRHTEFTIIETLGKLKCSSQEELQIVAGYMRHDDPDIRRQSLKALAEMAGLEALPDVLAACNDPHWSVRMAALQTAGKIGGERGVPAVLASLSDPDCMVRKTAVGVLGDLQSLRTIPDLVKLLTDMEMSKYAFEALLKFGRSALPWLHRTMRGDYPNELRERVIDLVGKIGDRRSLEPLMEMLEDRNQTIRLATIDSLAFCFDSLPLKRLTRLKRHDADEEVRRKADLALRTLTMERFL